MKKLKTIFLVTLFCQFTKTTLAQVPATWTVNPSAYTYQMSATTKANEACIDLIDANNYVAAFVGSQCRGVVKTNTNIGPNMLGLLTIKSNMVSGEKVSFKIYKASTNSVLNVLDSVIFSQGATFGNLSNPFTLYTNHRPTDISIGTYMVNENTPLATVMSSLSAVDQDAGTVFTYSLTAAQTENMQFGVSGSNLTVNSLFDYETDSIKIIQLEVDDNGGCKFAETFTLHILNINETPTSFTLTSPSISDHQQAGSLMGKFSTIDPDFNDAHIYTLVGGLGSTDNAQFYIQNDTLYNVSLLDYITQSVYYIRARSTDIGGLFIENTFTVNILNINDAPSDILLSNYFIAENTVLATTIGTLSVIDADPLDTHTLTLDPGTGSSDNAKVSVIGNSLTVNTNYNFELKDSLFIRLKATDQLGAYYAKTFTIVVTDVNEMPTNIAITNTIVLEGLPISTNVGVLSTTDEDFLSTHTYSLVTGLGDTDNALFATNSNTLVSNTTYSFTNQTYSVRLRTTDVGNFTFEKIVTIAIRDSNYVPTNILSSTLTINENVPIGTPVVALTTIDYDATDTHTLELVPGLGSQENIYFSLNGNLLQNDSTINFEKRTFYRVRIKSTDPIGASITKTFTLTVNDLNETPTQIALSHTIILEGLPLNTLVGVISTVDEDLPPSYTYSLVTGLGDTDNALFGINTNSLVTAATYSYTGQIYSVRLRTTDGGGLFLEKAFLISVRDSNYVPTDIIPSILAVNENIPLASPIVTLTTIDYDATDVHTLSLVPGVGAQENIYFSLNGNVLQNDSIINFEKRTFYRVRIKSTDPAGASITKTFTLTVNDLNETPTNIALSNTIILEGLASGTSVGLITTTDEDVASIHSYSLVAGLGDMDNALFAINTNSLATAATYSFVGQTYSVRLRSTDAGGLFFEKPFLISVRDSNYVPTDIIPSSLSFDENIILATSVATLVTIDYDSQDTHTLALVSGSGSSNNSYFKIVDNELITDSLINFERKSTFFVRIKSTDPGNKSVIKTFTFTANDLNEAPTKLTLTGDSVYELLPINAQIGVFTTTDEDAGATHTYSLTAGLGDTDNALFAINSNSLVSNAVYAFSGQYYSIRVKTIDNGSLSLEKVFLIKILNVNEPPTDIIIDTLTLNEDNEPMHVISKMKSIDIDFPDFHIYTLVSGTGADDNSEFAISGDNLMMIYKTNYDIKTAYKVRIQSTDVAGSSIQKSFEINVLNIIGNVIPLPSTNYISPNGDGKNDFWKIENVDIYKDFSLQIFDQFGQVIYDVPNNYNNEFDGKYKETPLPTGNYYFIFKRDKKLFKGNITIIN